MCVCFISTTVCHVSCNKPCQTHWATPVYPFHNNNGTPHLQLSPLNYLPYFSNRYYFKSQLKGLAWLKFCTRGRGGGLEDLNWIFFTCLILHIGNCSEVLLVLYSSLQHQISHSRPLNTEFGLLWHTIKFRARATHSHIQLHWYCTNLSIGSVQQCQW